MKSANSRLSNIPRYSKSPGHDHPTTKANPKKEYNFTERLQAGHALEQDTKLFNEFRLNGIELYDYGLQFYPDQTREKIISYNNHCALLARHAPDKIALHTVVDLSFFVDAKTTVTASTYYSVSLGAYRTQLATALRDTDYFLLYVFPPSSEGEAFRAAWVQDIEPAIARTITDLRELRSNRGSGLPFVLIDKRKIPPLQDTLRQFLKVEISGAVA